MKKLKIIGIVLLIIVILAVITSVLYWFLSHHETEKYKDYTVIDANLTWRYALPSWGRYNADIYEPDNAHPYTHVHHYKKLLGESDGKFIGAHIQCIAFPWNRYEENWVLINPDYKLDIWRDWHVNEIEIYEKIYNSKNGEYTKKIIASTKDKDAIFEFVEKRIDNAHVDTAPLSGEFADKSYGIRLSFEESNNIVWDAGISFYEDGSLSIYCDSRHIREHDEDFAKIESVVIFPGTPLYDFIMEAIS